MKLKIIILIIIFIFLIFFYLIYKKPTLSQYQDIIGFIRIDGGSFIMGSPGKEPGRWSKGWREKQRLAHVKSFYIAQYMVTQKEYYSIMKHEMPLVENENLPIYGISWFEAIEFCNKLSIKHELEPVYTIFYDRIKQQEESFIIYEWNVVHWNKKANGYRLPTNTEWECAIRADTRTPYYTGDTISINNANFNLYYPELGKTVIMPVGSYAPNPWGLYDMAGNVWEWCWDWSEISATSSGKVIRGGSFSSPVINLRSAAGSTAPIDNKNSNISFRLVRSVFP